MPHGTQKSRPRSRAPVLVLGAAAVRAAVAVQHILRPFPRGAFDDRLVLAGEQRAFVIHLAGVDGVREDSVQQALRERLAAPCLAGLGCPPFRSPAAPVQILEDRQHGAQFEVLIEDGPYLVCFVWIHDEAARLVVDVVAEDRVATDPLALLARGTHLVAGPLRDQFPFELGER